jgi:hypothetical protein
LPIIWFKDFLLVLSSGGQIVNRGAPSPRDHGTVEHPKADAMTDLMDVSPWKLRSMLHALLVTSGTGSCTKCHHLALSSKAFHIASMPGIAVPSIQNLLAMLSIRYAPDKKDCRCTHRFRLSETSTGRNNLVVIAEKVVFIEFFAWDTGQLAIIIIKQTGWGWHHIRCVHA